MTTPRPTSRRIRRALRDWLCYRRDAAGTWMLIGPLEYFASRHLLRKYGDGGYEGLAVARVAHAKGGGGR